MNLRQSKKYKVYSKVQKFFQLDGPDLIVPLPDLKEVIEEFELRFAAIKACMMAVARPTKGITANKRQIRNICLVSILKLLAVMKYRYTLTDDKTGFDMANRSATSLKKLSISDFFIYCQTVMGHYVPAIYTPLGVAEAEMNALKLRLEEYPAAMQEASDGRVKRKNAVADLLVQTREMDYFLKYRAATLIYVADEKFASQKIEYKRAIHIGITAATAGPPHKQGKPAAGEVVVLNKAKYRSKLAIIVRNNGTTPIIAGRSSNGTEIQGTPFIIEPGKTRKRISQKLGSKGQFIVLQNVGDGAGSFKVWMKE